MTKQNVKKSKINRREFVAMAAVAGAATTLAGCSAKSQAKTGMSVGQHRAKRVGISEAAYKKAWKRAAALVSKMTLAEKVTEAATVAPIKRLGLPFYSFGSGECLHGVVWAPATAFPLPLAMACSWDPALALKVYTAVSDEARAFHSVHRDNGGLSYFSPQTLNLHRDPRWGRCEEAPGEDPCLAGTWGASVIRGMQGPDTRYLKTTSCIKHFICNNTDDDRFSVSAAVNPRSFWEYYTRAYEACVVEADAFAVMGSYNAVNGIPCCANHFLLTTLLRGHWGFRGYVVSDCDAIGVIFNPHHYVPTAHQAAAVAMHAGCDLNCGDTYKNHLAKAVADKLVSEADITQSIMRWLTVRFLVGEFDPPEEVPYSKISLDVVNSPAHQALAIGAARESIVLLKNNDNFLPLDRSSVKKIAVIGPTAGFHLGGYSGSPPIHINPLDGIAKAFGASLYEHVWSDQLQACSPEVQTQPVRKNRTNISAINDMSWVEYKPQDFTGKNRIAIRMSCPGAGASIHVHIDSVDSPPIATLTVPKTGSWDKWTTISAAISGVTGKHKVFFTFTRAPGKTMPNLEWFQLQPYVAPQPDQPVVFYQPGCTVDGPKDEKMFTAAVDAAKNADVVIMVCGVNQSVDMEGHDRKDIKLPGVQHELIQACFQANPKTVLVLNSNNTVAVNWEQANLPAIVAAIFGGQAEGTAIADVLFGNYNPGGKTCCTWYKSVDQLPPFHNYDIMKGRTYMYFAGKPLYPFGYGLSYTSFQISDLHVDSRTLSATHPVQVSCRVKNTGSRAGAEVVQFYVTVPKSPVKRPIKELVGFQRVELKPGESRKVTFTLPYTARALWYWHESQKKFVVQPGSLKLMIGNSSANIALSRAVTLRACTDATLGGPRTLDTMAVPVEVS